MGVQIKKQVRHSAKVLLFALAVLPQKKVMPQVKQPGDPLGPGLVWATGLVFLMAVAVGLYLFYQVVAGPDPVEKIAGWEVDEMEVLQWMEQSVEAEENFNRDWKAFPDDPDVFQELERAIVFQRKLAAIDPENGFGAISRLDALLEKLEDTKGRLLYSEARANSERAADLVARGDSLSAISLLERALANQEWINAHLQGSDLVDAGEVSRIRQRLSSLETVDAVENVETLWEEGKIAYETGELDEAEALFDRALAIQESINLNMPASAHVRWRLIQEMRDYKRRIEAARMNQRIDQLIAAFQESREAGILERALNLQVLLNQRYASTEFADEERVKVLKIRLATDQSTANAALLLQQSALLNACLREKRWENLRPVLLELEGAVREFTSRFSETLLPDPDLRDKIGWLIEMEETLPALVESVENHLIELPELGIRMYDAEVDQGLFELIMGKNPSRWVGADRPVDSVTFAEAEQFCERLGWALGTEVCLPELSWASSAGAPNLSGGNFWFSGNSRFQSQPVRSSPQVEGFYDLFGNVAEWVTVEGGDRAAGLYGGSGSDVREAVRQEPLNRVAANFRSRWAGFRFCVKE